MHFFDYPGSAPGSSGADDADRPLFSGFSETDWWLVVEASDRLDFREGQEIIRAGQRDDTIYILASGAVEVIVKGKVIDELAAGSAFGEVAFFDGAHRTATIRGMSDGSALSFSRGSLDRLAAKAPDVALKVVLEFGRLLSQRFRPLLGRD